MSFIRGKGETLAVFQYILDQAGVRRSSLYGTGTVLCWELLHIVIPGDPVSVSSEKQYSWFSDEIRCIRNGGVAAFRSEALFSFGIPRQICTSIFEVFPDGRYQHGS